MDTECREVSRSPTGFGIAAIHALVIVLSLAGPALILFDSFRHDGRFALRAWRNVFADWSRWQTLLSNTGVVALCAVTLSCVLGIALAGLLFKANIRGRLAGIGLLLLAAAVPLYAVNGAAASIIGLDSLRGSTIAVGLIHAAAHLPIVVLLIGFALRGVPAAAEEAALLDGATPLRAFLLITMRLGIGGVVAAVVVVLLWVLTDYSVSDILMVRTFAEEVYTQYALHSRPEEPALVCVPQILLFGGLLWTLRRSFLTPTSSMETVRAGYRFNVGRWRTPLSVLAVVIPLAIVVALLIALVAPLRASPNPLHVASWFVDELTTSLITSAAAGMIAAGLGVGIAWTIVRKPRWRPLLAAYVVTMLAIPAPIIGMGLIRMFNRPGAAGWLYDSPAILTVAYVVRFLPIAVILLIPAVRTLPIECEQAARADGCSQLGVWHRIVWPPCYRMVLVVVFIVTVLAIGELPCSILVTPPGFNTVGARFFSLVHYGMYPDAAMLCLLSIGSVLVPCACLLLLLKHRLAD
ncbi:MAG: iron ABC transporter permease [Planctomycetes bacterium]|nr:iron ABC transporter permease [Planctomycetota bacterium]